MLTASQEMGRVSDVLVANLTKVSIIGARLPGNNLNVPVRVRLS